jgi:hypothetical protein
MIRLHWAVHSHQPVGNFDFIFERAHAQAYAPFLETLAAHPSIRMSMHFSGILLDWLEAKRPEYLKSLRVLVDRGQVEILGGGFYEPILPVISDGHKRRQLDKLQEAARRLFGVTPRGLWLAERVWEPGLVKPIAEAGLEYVLLDGSHFKMVGKQEKDMDGYFVSEDQGLTLKLFPIHDVIRDFIPFRPVEEVVDALLALDGGGAGMAGNPISGAVAGGAGAAAGGAPGGREVQVVFGDDGEKFGDWPGTNGHVYGANRWLHRFFEAVEARPDRLRVEPMCEALRPEKNLGLVYLPPASYQEMMSWAQDAQDILLLRKTRETLVREGGAEGVKFLRGTFWRNFFNKYPESNRMHKQGVRLARDIDALGTALEPAARDQALDHVLQSQCNCGYWHGVFGGLYLPHLRFALYRNLIAAQRVLDASLFKPGGPAPAEPVWEVRDWNCDGLMEYTLNSPEAYLSFTLNGELDQFWLKRTGINLVDTLTRRFEAYHENLGGGAGGGTKLENQLAEKEANLRSYLVYDGRTRHSLADLYLVPGTGLSDYLPQNYRQAYHFVPKETVLERGPAETSVRFIGWGMAATDTGPTSAPVFSVEKRVILARGASDLRVEWRFRNLSAAPVAFRFGCEALFCLLAGNAPDRYIDWEAGTSVSDGVTDAEAGASGRDILASRGELAQIASVRVTDEWLRLRCEVRFPGATRVWRDALETVSQSEGGYERVYQGTVVVPIWDIRLEPRSPDGPGGEAAGPSEVRAALSIQISEGA